MTWYIADGVFTKKPRPGATVFRANPADGEIILPEGVVSIARDAFLDVPGVKRVVVPEGCRYIDEPSIPTASAGILTRSNTLHCSHTSSAVMILVVLAIKLFLLESLQKSTLPVVQSSNNADCAESPFT